MNSSASVRVWQVPANTAANSSATEQRPPDFTGTCRPSGAGVLHLEVVSGVPTGDPAATFVVEGRGAFELVRREGTRPEWGMRRRLVLTLRPREPRQG